MLETQKVFGQCDAQANFIFEIFLSNVLKGQTTIEEKAKKQLNQKQTKSLIMLQKFLVSQKAYSQKS